MNSVTVTDCLESSMRRVCGQRAPVWGGLNCRVPALILRRCKPRSVGSSTSSRTIYRLEEMSNPGPWDPETVGAPRRASSGCPLAWTAPGTSSWRLAPGRQAGYEGRGGQARSEPRRRPWKAEMQPSPHVPMQVQSHRDPADSSIEISELAK